MDSNDELNLHKFTVEQAIETFTLHYNQKVSNKMTDPLRINHGYGSTGVGGEIKRRLRTLLVKYQEQRLCDYIAGETYEGNPGITIVYPIRSLPYQDDTLKDQILNYCNVGKTEKKVYGKFRRFGDPKIKIALNELLKDKKLLVDPKGREKCYKTAS